MVTTVYVAADSGPITLPTYDGLQPAGQGGGEQQDIVSMKALVSHEIAGGDAFVRYYMVQNGPLLGEGDLFDVEGDHFFTFHFDPFGTAVGAIGRISFTFGNGPLNQIEFPTIWEYDVIVTSVHAQWAISDGYSFNPASFNFDNWIGVQDLTATSFRVNLLDGSYYVLVGNNFSFDVSGTPLGIGELTGASYFSSTGGLRFQLSGVSVMMSSFVTYANASNEAAFLGDVLDGADTISAGNGSDTISGGSRDDTLSGGNGVDWLLGDDGNDSLFGGDGNDGLSGGLGNDLIQGGNDNDMLSGDAGNDSLDGGNGNDSFYGGAGDDVVAGGAGFDWLFFAFAPSGVAVVVSAGTGTAIGDGSDSFSSIDFIGGTPFADTFTGGASNDQFAPGFGNDIINADAGIDWVTYFDASSGVSVNLDTGVVTGGSGNDTLSGVEQIGGTPFADVIIGNAANNYFRGDDSGTGAIDTFDGAGGNDEVDYRSEASGVRIDLVAGTATNGLGVVDRLISIEWVYGSGFADTIYGTSGADGLLNGRGGNDTIYGGYNSDYIIAGTGNDYVDGGEAYDFDRFDRLDFDTVDYSNISATAGILVNMAAHTVSGNSSVGIDTLLDVESVRGTAFDDTFYGGGGGRFEQYRGGGGNDLIVGSGINTRAEYSDATGSVSILLSSASDGLGTVTGVGVGTDTVRYVNQFYGGGFNDTYDASAFSVDFGELTSFNEFRGGAGNDTIIGNGNTRITYSSSTSGIVFDFAAGTVADGLGGVDTFSSISQVTGTAQADTFYGASASEFFQGNGGNDTIYGGDGNDVARYDGTDADLTVGIQVDMAAGTVTGDPTLVGTDRLFGIEGIDGSLRDDVYVATGFNSGSQRGTLHEGAFVNSLYNRFAGGDGNDTITGNGQTSINYSNAQSGIVVTFTGQGAGSVVGGADVDTDTFTGVYSIVDSVFNDTLYGSDTVADGYFEIFNLRAGDDTAYGGLGTDFVSYSNATGTAAVVIDLGQNTATGSSIGNDRLFGIEGAIGDDGNDTLVGDAGANTFSGGGGNDTIDGAGGDDFASYWFDSAGVTVNLGAGTATDSGGGGDTLLGIENLQGSRYADVLTGNDSANLIMAEDGTDTLFGAGGNDTLSSGVADSGGYNLLYGGDGIDTVSYEAATASVYADIGSTGGHVGGVLTDIMSGVENLLGGSGADVLVGDGGVNRLHGGGGTSDDLLFGGGGNDVLVGGDHAAVSFNQLFGGDGIDTADYSAEIGKVFVDLRAPAGHIDKGGGFVLNDLMNSVENAIGSSNIDILIGTDEANSLSGGGSYDLLFGYGGDDILNGGAGGTGTYNQLWGDTGSDTASYEFATTRVYADLRVVAGWVTDGGGTLVLNDVYNAVENFIGGAVADSLVGDDNANRLTGGGGADLLYGFGGADTFVYRSALESSLTTGYDSIADFESGSDKLDLTAFGITAGDVLIAAAGGFTSAVYANTDGISGYDLALVVTGTTASIQLGDILL